MLILMRRIAIAGGPAPTLQQCGRRLQPAQQELRKQQALGHSCTRLTAAGLAQARGIAYAMRMRGRDGGGGSRAEDKWPACPPLRIR
jgi:hypothetical protein